MVDFPTSKVRTIDIPSFAFAVGCQHERALARANQYSYSAHPALLPATRVGVRRNLVITCQSARRRARRPPHPCARLFQCIVDRADSNSTGRRTTCDHLVLVFGGPEPSASL